MTLSIAMDSFHGSSHGDDEEQEDEEGGDELLETVGMDAAKTLPALLSSSGGGLASKLAHRRRPLHSFL